MTWDIAFATGLGLIVGSFVNVLIHRLPRMIMLGDEFQNSTQRYNLCWPRSHCPHCLTTLQIWENIPLFSFIWLKGRCNSCNERISLQYPAIEFATSLLWLFCSWHWGVNTTGLSWAIYSTLLLALAFIDYQTTLLPDDLTQTLLWCGLAASALAWIDLPPQQSVWGAIVGYTSMWSVAFIFERVTRKQGMGAGDFKLFAALGAWLGPVALLPIIMLASICGAATGVTLQLKQRLASDGYLPFGPFLAAAGFSVAVIGMDTVSTLLGWPPLT